MSDIKSPFQNINNQNTNTPQNTNHKRPPPPSKKFLNNNNNTPTTGINSPF